MHIPPYYKQRKWQFFFIGIIVGVIIGYLFFLYTYGEHTERWIEENLALREQVRELEQNNELLKQDKDTLDKERLTIQELEVEWLNIEEEKLDRFTIYHLTRLVEEELQPIIGRNIDSISEQRDLLIRTIENKSFSVSSINYKVTVKQLIISTTLIISLEVDQDSS